LPQFGAYSETLKRPLTPDEAPDKVRGKVSDKPGAREDCGKKLVSKAHRGKLMVKA
jgi:hypothetical protein